MMMMMMMMVIMWMRVMTFMVRVVEVTVIINLSFGRPDFESSIFLHYTFL